MLMKMLNRLQDAWRSASISTLAALSGSDAAERTRMTWARVIESYTAVPDIYKDFFEPYRADGRPFPYTVMTPSYKGFIHRTTEKLVCDLGEEIDILERAGNKIAAQCYPLGGISFVEFGTILLESWVKISGVAKDGLSISSTFKFNSVTDYLFTPILERIRRSWIQPSPAESKGAAQSSELEKFNRFVRINFKFMSYAKRSLLAGEKVILAVLQPEIRAETLAFLGKTYYRTVSPAQMLILTDRELILIREDTRWGEEVKYGGTWDYVPLDKVISLSQGGREEGLQVLSIQLTGGASLEFVFQASAQPEIDLLLDRFR